MEPLILQAAGEDTGKRLDAWLAEQTELTRSAAQKLLEEGRVTAGGKPLAKNTRLTGAETVSVLLPEPETVDEPAQPVKKPSRKKSNTRKKSVAKTDDKTAEKKAAEKKPTEKKPAEKKPAEKKPAEESDELTLAVEKVLTDQAIVPQVVKFIRQYKTKQGINNALNKEFKDSKRTSEIYSAIKPLIADKKGK